ncbi:Transcriptional corepressor LEUNIG [Forsythia ovata]|uniref:Transcriptional corepressor LEUNIG n=1 Tax=Forsythia ovata TaxID=205694 RepID=A0ABD1QCW4_9LAMI
MHTTAEIFAKEAEVNPKAVANNLPEEFLTDWWSLFWDVYCARGEDARRPDAPEASSSKQECATIGAHLQPDFKPNLAVQTSGELILSALGNSTNAANPILIDDSLNWKHLQVLIWNIESLSTNIIKAHSHLISDIRFKPNSTVFATSSFDRSVQVWDAVKPTKSNSRLVGHVEPVMSLDFHPTKANILCSCDSNDEIRLWNVNESACIRAFKGANRQVRFQPRSGNLLAAATGNVINMIDVETGTIHYRLEGHAKDVRSMCWDISGRYMASVSEDCARIWSIVAGGKSVHHLQSIENKFVSCTFHPVYSLVLAIGSYQSLEIWNPMNGIKMWTHRAHEGIVSGLTHTFATHKIASVSQDSWMKVWK